VIVYRLTIDDGVYYAESWPELRLLFEVQAPFARTVRLVVVETRKGRIAP
jgi:hypothetical protein